MPTTSEFIALGEAVTTALTADYQGSGVAGLILTDNDDDSKVLFFPAAGFCYNGSVGSVGDCGYCWSSSLFTSRVCDVYSLYFNGDFTFWNRIIGRCNGHSVRGVLDE